MSAKYRRPTVAERNKLMQEIHTLRGKLHNKDVVIANLEQQLKSKTNEAQKLQKAYNSQELTIQANHSTVNSKLLQIKRLENELQSSKLYGERMAQKVSLRDATIAGQGNTITVLEQAISRQDDDIDSKNSCIKSLESELKKLQGLYSKKQDEVIAQSQTIRENNLYIGDLERQRSELLNEVEDCHSSMVTLASEARAAKDYIKALLR